MQALIFLDNVIIHKKVTTKQMRKTHIIFSLFEKEVIANHAENFFLVFLLNIFFFLEDLTFSFLKKNNQKS